MKKILSIAVSALMLVSCLTAFASCTGTASAFKAYSDAEAKLAAAKATDVTVSMKMDLSGSGISMTTETVSDNQVTGIGTDKLSMLSTTNTSLLGNEMKSVIYYADGWLYSSGLGLNFKTALDLEAFDEQYGSDYDSEKFALELPDEALKDAKAVKVAEGTEYSASLDAKYIQQQLQGLLGGEESINYATATLSAIEFSYVIGNDGNLVSYKMKFTASGNADVFGSGTESEFSVTIDMTLTVNALNDAVSITPPDNLDKYTEFSDFN